jgi:hypothetical protein
MAPEAAVALAALLVVPIFPRGVDPDIPLPCAAGVLGLRGSRPPKTLMSTAEPPDG